MNRTQSKRHNKLPKLQSVFSYCSLALGYLAISFVAGLVIAVLTVTGLVDVSWGRYVSAGEFCLAVVVILLIPGRWAPRGMFYRLVSK